MAVESNSGSLSEGDSAVSGYDSEQQKPMSVTIERADTYAALLFLALSAGIYAVSGGFPAPTGSGPGPAFFPRAIAACIAVLAVGQIAKSQLHSDETAHEVTWGATKRVLVPVALLVAYVAALPTLGFVVGTVVFMAVLQWYSGVESVGVIVGFSLVFTVVLQYVFGSLLHIPLPEGIVPVARLLPMMGVGL